MATLRSFRGVGGAQMVRHGQKGYFIGGRTVGQGDHDIKIYWSATERKLSLDNQPVRKLTSYLGVLRVVVFCTEDLQLVKGPARARRRFADLLLTQTQPPICRCSALRAGPALPQRHPQTTHAGRGRWKVFRLNSSKLGNEITRLRRATHAQALAAGPARLPAHFQ